MSQTFRVSGTQERHGCRVDEAVYVNSIHESISSPCRLVVKSPRCGSHSTVAPQVQFLPGTYFFVGRDVKLGRVYS